MPSGVKRKKARTGKLIVIDGADGSGKATQTNLLAKKLRKEGFRVKITDFPRYGDNFFGAFIGECLTGKYGDFIALDPHIASVLYAGDRYESKSEIEKWLDRGYVVIADRYVSANQIHQGGKVLDARARRKFLEWLDVMEFGVFGLPQPDRIVYLDVPLSVSKRLLQNQDAKQRKVVYMKGSRKKDAAEENDLYQENARKSALWLIRRKHQQWKRINCVWRGELLSRELIAEQVWQAVEKVVY